MVLARPEAPTRPLTAIEGAVVHVLLSGRPAPELPPSTFAAVRRRARGAGWLVERFLPNPVLLGRSRLTFALAHRPSPLDRTLWPRWQEVAGAAVVWRTPEVLFGVFQEVPPQGAPSIERELGRTSQYDRSFHLPVDLGRPTVPVYFDFEAVWGQVVGSSGTVGYPRAWPLTSVLDPGPRDSITPRWRRRLGEALAGPAGLPSDTVGPMRFRGSPGVLRAARRRGWLDERAFLQPSALPAFGAWSIKEVVFAYGPLRQEIRAEIVFRTLLERCGVAPFLFATDERSVLVGLLAPAPRSLGEGGPRASVRATLEGMLERLGVERLPADAMEVVVNHRYEALLE